MSKRIWNSTLNISVRYGLCLLLLAFVLGAAAPAQAQWNSYQKWEIAPFVGYETGGSYPVTNSFVVDKLRIDGGLSYGTFIDYSLTENAQAEFMWARNNTSFAARDAATHVYTKAFNTDFDQYSFGFLYMLKNSERKLRPFIAAGIGFSHEFNDAGNPNRTLLAFNLGGGAKYNVSKHFSLRGDLRWIPSRANRTPAISCDAFGDCFQQNASNYLERVNFSGGFAFHF